MMRHDDLLADGVDRRVRHLREELLEVRVERLRLLREDRERRVGAHGADGLRAVLRHRVDEDPDVLRGVAELLLAAEHRLVVGLDHARRRRQVVERDEVLVEPAPVGLLGRDPLLQLVVRDDAPLGGVDEEHAARLQPALRDHAVGGDVEDADLARHDDEVVLRDVVARRPEAVAVEHRAHLRAVGEGDGRRAVPRLHEAGVVLVEGLLLRAHRVVPAERLRDHHHHRVRQRAAGEVQELEDVVEHRRVGALGVDDGQDLLQVVAEQLRRHLRLPRVHPVDVAAQRVDLAVVRDVAVRVRARPRRERVRGEARVDHADGGLERLVREVGVERAELRRVQHALIDDGPVREGGHVEHALLRRRAPPHRLLDEAADDVELPLEAHVVEVALAADEDLPDDRLRGLRGRAEARVLGRHVAPAEDALPLRDDGLLEHPLAGRPGRGVLRQVHHPHAVARRSREPEPRPLGLAGQEGVRQLQEDAGAVPGVLLGSRRAAVLEVDEDLERLLDDRVRLSTLDVDDEPEATGVVLVPGIVEALGRGKSVLVHLGPS
jgi:hypothetical protein